MRPIVPPRSTNQVFPSGPAVIAVGAAPAASGYSVMWATSRDIDACAGVGGEAIATSAT
jgi:hypothetical protein